MRILEFEKRELTSKREWLDTPDNLEKPKTISFEVERLKRTNPELFDFDLFRAKNVNNTPWDFEDYRKRKEILAQGDAVLALAVGFSLPGEGSARFAARMFEMPIMERRRNRKLKLIK